MGLRVVCSSLRGGGRLGNIDTIALDRRNRPTTPKWRSTVDRLKEKFPRFDEA
jgi:hypothetical protein